ncbi:hypothetical protein BBAD15_g8942 [Beauveria bassiana D1-5]|uniref:Uncharacterized protein n=1 Tax=Beauveria bassiana D1-5 TaxID=1245745 RepID=A0A0A2VE34_BEABA|nr:hypothetical protein BBAD15_g8942 [Beauveria bassiana D1-5]
MDTSQSHQDAVSMPSPHREKPSAGPGLLSRFPFMKPALGPQPIDVAADGGSSQDPGPFHTSPIPAQPKTRRRRGSLRKVALLGRGAQRDKRDGKHLAIDTAQATAYIPLPDNRAVASTGSRDALGLDVADIRLQANPESLDTAAGPGRTVDSERDADAQATQDTSTTDEDDALHITHNATPSRPNLSASSSGSDSYFTTRASSPRPNSFQPVKSPLSYSGISTNTIPTSDADWDYAETEWWGWVVLTVTWLVFVIGMGSCLDVWSWAWDVGKTPYAPPELEDDPTLPIVGYYPALIILTCVMAWVWVVVAWVGMKYFRHAKISGD